MGSGGAKWLRIAVVLSDGSPLQKALTHFSDPRETSYSLQFNNAAAAFSGQPYSMPLLEDALRVQALIEAVLER